MDPIDAIWSETDKKQYNIQVKPSSEPNSLTQTENIKRNETEYLTE